MSGLTQEEWEYKLAIIRLFADGVYKDAQQMQNNKERALLIASYDGIRATLALLENDTATH